jgi:group I intron endonuclease
MLGTIYSATNQLNGKVYIGQTTRGLEDRIKTHYRLANRKKGYHFLRSLRKYKKEDWVWEILEEVEYDDKIKIRKILDKYEKHYIKIYNSSNGESGYNSTHGGEGVLANEETKRKMSIAKKGIPIEWTRHPLSEEHKAKIGLANSKKTRSEEFKNKVSNTFKGKKLSEEHKKKISKSKLDKHYHMSEENKIKFSLLNKGVPKHSEEFKKYLHDFYEGKKRNKDLTWIERGQQIG